MILIIINSTMYLYIVKKMLRVEIKARSPEPGHPDQSRFVMFYINFTSRKKKRIVQTYKLRTFFFKRHWYKNITNTL